MHNSASHCLLLACGIFQLKASSESYVVSDWWTRQNKYSPLAAITRRVGPFASCVRFFTGRTLTYVPYTASRTTPTQILGVPVISFLCLASHLFILSCRLFVECNCRVVLVQEHYCSSHGVHVAQLFEALLYKPEGRGFDSRWCHLDFLLI